MTELISVARPYATAAFEFACLHKNIDYWQRLLSFAAQVSRDPQMVRLLTNPITAALGAGILQDICQTTLDRPAKNFMQLMAQNGRLLALTAVCERFTALQQAYEQQATVEVIAASPLTSEQLQRLSSALTQRLARSVTLHCRVDPTLLAGLMIRLGDWTLDGSVRGKLNRLAQQLQA
jgi:F-type H+-transporting ATPase subunit delta